MLKEGEVGKVGDVGRDGVKISLEYDPRAGNIQHFSKSKSSCNWLDSYMR